MWNLMVVVRGKTAQKSMETGMAYGGQPFTETFSVPDVGNIYLIWSN